MMHFVSLRYAQRNQHHKRSTPKLTRGTDKTAINADGSEEAKLWFYGASYGTLLGQTLAVLFPERIGRMILDGNVDGVQHYSGVPSDEVDAGDAVFHDFFTSCYEAGPRLCAYHGGATSVDDIENRYLDMLQNLRQMPALSNDNGKTNVITDLDVSMSMIKAMYSPLRAWPALALFLEDLESGSFVSAYHESMKIRSYYELTKGSQFSEANRFIRCLDADKNFAIESYDDYLDAIEVFRKESYFEGPLVSLVTLRDCIGMDITPPPSQQFPGRCFSRQDLTASTDGNSRLQQIRDKRQFSNFVRESGS
jgi:pimeloyl-ACP methyl ester carboxylesterase